MRWLLFCALLLSHYTYADTLIIEPDQGRAPIESALNQTKHHVSLIIYGLTDRTLVQDLIQQKERGKSVRVILEKNPFKTPRENIKTMSLLDNAHVQWQGTLPLYRFIHQKTLIIDDQQALVMTFNFTHSAFKRQRNFALVIENPKLVNEIASVFSADWNHKITAQHSADLIYSPDDSRQKIIAFINSATISIQLYVQSLSDYEIIGALAKTARRGVKVEILTSNRINEGKVNYLERAGVKIHRSTHLYIHAKAMMIDHQKALIGSTNFTRTSLDDNRELSAITHDVNIVKQLEATFRKDWA